MCPDRPHHTPPLDRVRRRPALRLHGAGLLRRGGLPSSAADPRAVATADGTPSSRATTSSPDSRSGSPPADSSSAPSGGTAPYQAPDWTADWLHREPRCWLCSTSGRARTARPSRRSTGAAGRVAQPPEASCAHEHVRPRPERSPSRPRATRHRRTATHYDGLFGGASSAEIVRLRDAYAMQNAVTFPMRSAA